jgi:hypothetical protein
MLTRLLTLLKRRSFVLVVLWLALPLATPAAVRAEEPPAQEAAMARTLFMQGTKAAKAGDWVRARDAFAASYALRPSMRTLFNLGIARVELGELVAGSEALRAFVRDADPEKEADNLGVARRELARIEPLIAHVRVDAEAGAQDQLEVDGRVLPGGVIGTELPLDPGNHRIRWLRPERVVADQEIALAPGQRTTVALEASPAPPAAEVAQLTPPVVVPEPEPTRTQAPVLATSALPERTDDSPRRRRRWIIGTAVAAAVVGGGLAAYFLVREDEKDVELVDSNVTDGVWRVP